MEDGIIITSVQYVVFEKCDFKCWLNSIILVSTLSMKILIPSIVRTL